MQTSFMRRRELVLSIRPWMNQSELHFALDSPWVITLQLQLQIEFTNSPRDTNGFIKTVNGRIQKWILYPTDEKLWWCWFLPSVLTTPVRSSLIKSGWKSWNKNYLKDCAIILCWFSRLKYFAWESAVLSGILKQNSTKLYSSRIWNQICCRFE